MKNMEIVKGIEIIDLCLYLKKEKILIIADTHIGYEEALNKQGVLIPRFQFKEIIERLEKILGKREIDKIIINNLQHFLITSRIIPFCVLLRGNSQIGLAESGKELTAHPTKDVIDEALRVTNIRIFSETHRVESRVGELVNQHLQWHAILKAHRDGSSEGVHKSTDGASLFGHRDENFPGSSIFIKTNIKVALMSIDTEFMGNRLPRVGKPLPSRLGDLFFLRFVTFGGRR